jgi:hypothetical protein
MKNEQIIVFIFLILGIISSVTSNYFSILNNLAFAVLIPSILYVLFFVILSKVLKEKIKSLFYNSFVTFVLVWIMIWILLYNL